MRKVTTKELAGLVRFANHAIESCVEQHGNLFVLVENKPYQLKEVAKTLKLALIDYWKQGEDNGGRSKN